MTTLPKEIQVNAGESLSDIASTILGDSSMWRELADFNNLDIFSILEIGQTLKVPTKEEAERRLKNQAATEITQLNSKVQQTVTDILNSREAKSITKLLGINVNQQQILKDLDLSSIAKSLNKPTDAERLKKALNMPTEVPAWQIIDWVLIFVFAIIIPQVISNTNII